MAFDPLAFVRKLEEAGMDRQQAMIIAEPIAELYRERARSAPDAHAPITRADLQETFADLRAMLRRELWIGSIQITAAIVLVITLFEVLS